MSSSHDANSNQDTQLENFAAELTRAARRSDNANATRRSSIDLAIWQLLIESRGTRVRDFCFHEA
jgi:hypothetical protein